MLPIRSYTGLPFADRDRPLPATGDADDRRRVLRSLVGANGYQVLVDLVENDLEALVNMGALDAAREDAQLLADLGCDVGRWERRIADAERKEAA